MRRSAAPRRSSLDDKSAWIVGGTAMASTSTVSRQPALEPSYLVGPADERRVGGLRLAAAAPVHRDRRGSTLHVNLAEGFVEVPTARRSPRLFADNDAAERALGLEPGSDVQRVADARFHPARCTHPGERTAATLAEASVFLVRGAAGGAGAAVLGHRQSGLSDRQSWSSIAADIANDHHLELVRAIFESAALRPASAQCPFPCPTAGRCRRPVGLRLWRRDSGSRARRTRPRASNTSRR